MGDKVQLIVDAPVDDVRAVLEQALGTEAGQLSVEDRPRDPFDVDSRGEALTFATVVTWTALAAAGGVVGNVAHDGLKKAASVLVAKFGERNVREEHDDGSTDDGAAST